MTIPVVVLHDGLLGVGDQPLGLLHEVDDIQRLWRGMGFVVEQHELVRGRSRVKNAQDVCICHIGDVELLRRTDQDQPILRLQRKHRKGVNQCWDIHVFC